MSFDLIDPEGLLASPTLQGYQSLPSGPPKLRRSATSSSFARANEGISTFASVTRTKEGLRKMTQNLLQPFSKEKRPTFEDETELLEPKKKYPQDYSGPDSRMQPTHSYSEISSLNPWLDPIPFQDSRSSEVGNSHANQRSQPVYGAGSYREMSLHSTSRQGGISHGTSSSEVGHVYYNEENHHAYPTGNSVETSLRNLPQQKQGIAYVPSFSDQDNGCYNQGNHQAYDNGNFMESSLRNTSQQQRGISRTSRFSDVDDPHSAQACPQALGSSNSMEVSPTKLLHKSRGMSQSRSESHIDHSLVPPTLLLPVQNESRNLHTHGVMFGHELQGSPYASPSRGRPANRMHSPTPLHDIYEDQPYSLEPSLSKRNRSPAKQALGDRDSLARSTSIEELPSQPAVLESSVPNRNHSPTKQVFGGRSLLGRSTGMKDLPSQPAGFESSLPKLNRSPSKQLFGDRGFLGRSTSMKEAPNPQYRKKSIKDMSGRVRQRLGEFALDLGKKILPAPGPPHHPKTGLTSRWKTRFPTEHLVRATFLISLGPSEQAELYRTVELMVCAAANDYLKIQVAEGRMDPATLRKAINYYIAQNRPQVFEYHFDQRTQCQLINDNIQTFRFYGERAEDLIAVRTMLNCWQHFAREMSVRTFCSPDAVIKKQLQDVYKVLEMLGAKDRVFYEFQGVQIRALKTMKDAEEKKAAHENIQWGVEHAWEPKEEDMVPDELNPFA